MSRDLSQSQFERKAKALGFKPAYFGYWKLPEPNANTEIYPGNAGDRRRNQLAYLVKENARIKARSNV